MQPLHKEGLPHVCRHPNALKSPQPGIRTYAPSHQPHWHTKSILTLNTNNRGRSRQTSLVNNKRKQANPCIGIIPRTDDRAHPQYRKSIKRKRQAIWLLNKNSFCLQQKVSFGMNNTLSWRKHHQERIEDDPHLLWTLVCETNFSLNILGVIPALVRKIL